MRNEKLPKQFSSLPYYAHIKKNHLFDTMHIKKYATKTLWKILDGSIDREKIVMTYNDIKEANHAIQSVIHSNSD